MFKFLNGDILNDFSEAIVNTVNCVGVMGKGIALQIKEKYPENFKFYKKHCDLKEVKIGKMLVYKSDDLIGSKFIINFPTKEHWKEYSKYEYIINGLKDLRKVIIENNIKSIAIPPLGCGNGGLEWNIIKQYIIETLSDLNANINVYEPNIEKDIMFKNEITEKQAIIYSLYKNYIANKIRLDDEIYINNLESQKLSYFLQETGCNLGLTYEKYIFGPYSEQLLCILNSMNNFLIYGFNKNIKTPYLSRIVVNEEKNNDVFNYLNKIDDNYKSKIEKVFNLINGFSGSFDLELLASIHYLIKYENSNDLYSVIKNLHNWNDRKKKIFSNLKTIEIAYNIVFNWMKS